MIVVANTFYNCPFEFPIGISKYEAIMGDNCCSPVKDEITIHLNSPTNDKYQNMAKIAYYLSKYREDL